MKFGISLMQSRRYAGVVMNYSYISITTLSINMNQ
jgi:hypothetical protein